MRPLNLFFRMMHCGLRLIDLGNQFRDLQHREHLSPVDVVSDIDVDVADVAGHLGVQFDVLVGDKLTRYRKRSGNGLALNRNNRGVRGMVAVCARAGR